jgi:hypothetical protein
MNIEDFWVPFEKEIESFDQLVDVIKQISDKVEKKKTQFVWRGQVDSSWALHSSLYRRTFLTKGTPLTENDFVKEECKVLIKLHKWGLHSSSQTGRLSILNQLAMLQHYGAPTRLIDITFNVWIGVWFAVQEKWVNGEVSYEDKDARLFAVDVSQRLINDNDWRTWEDDLHRPWGDNSSLKIGIKEWTTSVFSWRPPNLDGRITAQNGGFLFGGVVGTQKDKGGTFQFPNGWPIKDGRSACCLALRPHKFETFRGGANFGALYTFRIKASAKQEIRRKLVKIFGYTHAKIYPDYTGFAAFGTPKLRNK